MALTVTVQGQEPISALDIRVAYDPASLRIEHARLVGRARHAALAVNSSEAGRVHLALASAEPIVAEGRPLAVLRFAAPGRERVAAPSVSIRVNDD